MQPKRVLFIVFKGIGDVLLTTPLIRAVNKRWPGAEIFFLTKKASEKILLNNPRVSGVIIRGKGALKKIRALKIDTVIDFMRSAPSGCYSLFSGAERRIAFQGGMGRLFYNIRPVHSDRGYTVLDRLQILEPLGIEDRDISLELAFNPSNAEKVGAFLAASGLDPTKDVIVTFDVTSPRGHRLWPAKKFAALADMLSGKLGAKIVFLAGPGERAYVETALAASTRTHLLADNFDLLDLAALFRRVRLHVGTSSSPMHIAVSQETPTFTVYGLLNGPASWGPPLPIHAHAQGDLERLTPEEVFEKVKDHILAIRAGSGCENDKIAALDS